MPNPQDPDHTFADLVADTTAASANSSPSLDQNAPNAPTNNTNNETAYVPRRPTEALPPGASGKHTPWLLQYADFDYGAFMRRRNVRRIVTAIIAILALIFCFWLSAIFIPLLVALLIAYVLNPAVVWIEGRGASRKKAVATVFILFFALVVAILALVIPAMVQNIGQFTDLLGDEEAINGYIKTLVGYWNQHTPVPSWHVDPDQINASTMINEFIGDQGKATAASTSEATASALDVAGKVFGTLFTFGLFICLVPLYTFYFMLGLDRLWGKVKAYLPGTQRERILRILAEIHEMVSAFFRGRLIICLIVSALTVALFFIMGVPYAIFLGLLGGFGVIIPFFPMVASLIPAVLIMLMTGRFSGAEIGITAAIFLAIQGVEQFVLTPKILGKAVELHPVTLLVGVFVMATMFGFLGALLAVPLTAIAKILGREFILPYFQHLASERPKDPQSSGETSVVAAVAVSPSASAAASDQAGGAGGK